MGRADVLVEVRPLLRGVSHQYAFFVSLAAGAVLVGSTDTAKATAAAAIFAATVACMFAASALYHRLRCSPARREWMRRLDHAGIFLVIGGSYTPYTLLVLSGPVRVAVLALVWTGVAAAILLRWLWLTAPAWVSVGLGLALGWASLIALPQLFERVEPAGLLLLLSGGVLYSAGALVYALRRPDPWPAVFGFHELFHALVVAAVACQYAAIAFFVLPHA